MQVSPSLKRDMAEKTGKRTSNKQEALNAEFRRNVQQIDSEINQSMLRHAERIKQMHHEGVQDLRDLLKKKMQIEKDILETTTELQEAYERSKEIFEVVLNGRIEDCEKNLTQLKAIAEENCEHTAEESRES